MWLITSDLHFTDSPRDAYRNGIIDRLAEAAIEHAVTDIFILGDITDRKDNHSGAFINSLVSMFIHLYCMTDARIHILQGNHDYTDPDNPTLGFLPHIEDVDICWYGQSYSNLVGATKSMQSVVMMPYCRDPADFKSTIARIPEAEYAAAFFHQTFAGAAASSGMEMDGIPAELVRQIDAKRYFAGDIHVPQKIGVVEYVGSPYLIRFGDDFKSRFLRYNPETDELHNEYFDTIRKRTIHIASAADLGSADIRDGDQVKLRMSMTREKFSDWKSIEAEIVAAVKAAGADLYGVEITEDVSDAGDAPALQTASADPVHVFTDFCEANGVGGDLKKAGEKYL